MTIYVARKTVLISRETGLEIARRIVSELWGDADWRFQNPDVTDSGDAWRIIGTGIVDPKMQLDMRTRRGRLKLVISKFTGEILQLEH